MLSILESAKKVTESAWNRLNLTGTYSSKPTFIKTTITPWDVGYSCFW